VFMGWAAPRSGDKSSPAKQRRKDAVLGTDRRKNVCSFVGLDLVGAAVLRKRLRRDKIIDNVGKLPPSIIAMEACGGPSSQPTVRNSRARGPPDVAGRRTALHEGAKNDDRDVEGIAEAATRPTIGFAETRTEAHDTRLLQRLRDRLVGERTALINQLGAILLERGIVVPRGKRKLGQYLAILMEEPEGSLNTQHGRHGSPTARLLLVNKGIDPLLSSHRR